MSSDTPRRIAMWSGPRNVSTALLRSFGNRPDTAVCDEPFYAHYLVTTGLPHPGAERVIASQEKDWRVVASQLTGPVPGGRAVYYQKHMAHHLLDGMSGDWLDQLDHCFLIRHPRDMLLSLDAKFPNPGLSDTGLSQQWSLFKYVSERRVSAPPVIDARDLLTNPRSVLEELCRRLGIPFYDEMLSWPPGRRETDGVWAEHWYDQVERSTGFGKYVPKEGGLPAHLFRLFEECMEYYEPLSELRIRA